MNKRLICSLFALIFVCSFALAGFASAAMFVVVGIDDSDCNSFTQVGTLTNAFDDGLGVYFVGDDHYLSSVSGYFKNYSLVNSVVMRARLFNASASTHLPVVGQAFLEETGQVTVSTSSTGIFYFNFSSTYLLSSSESYVVALMVNGSVVGDVRLGFSTYASGMKAKYNADSGAWSASSTNPLGLMVYSTDTLGSGDPDDYGTPVPGGGVDIGGINWTSGVSWLAVLLLMLVPPFLLGVYMRGGKWGFLIGLAIGTGLSHFVFPLLVPIWLVVLIAIGLGAAFLTSVRQGG